MKEGPFFSVLISVYNAEKYLKECVDSVIAQSYENWEIVLLDDGSTDQTGKICDEYSEIDGRIRAFHQDNQGLASARNQTINEARGEFIIFLDGDDYWESPQMLYEVFCAIDKYKADLVVWWLKILNIYTGTIEKSTNFTEANDDALTGSDFLKATLANGKMKWWSWLYAFKRETWIKSGVSFTPGRIGCEDEEVLFRIFLQAKHVWVMNKYYYIYRIGNENSLTGKLRLPGLIGALEVADKNIKYLNNCYDDDLSLKHALIQNFSSTIMTVGLCLYKVDNKERNVLLQQIQKRKWMFDELRGYGNVKYRFKVMLIRILGIKNGFLTLQFIETLNKYLRRFVRKI